MKKFFAVAAVAFGLIASGNVLAHGAKPKHGGIVQAAGDLSFELASRGGATTIHVDDHGKDLATKGATGRLTVLKGTEKTEYPLEAGGANTLVVKGAPALAPGSKAVAAVNLPGRGAISVRFSIKK